MSTTGTTSGGFGNVATRTPAAGRWQWVGTANGCEARHLTDDPDLYLTAEPLSSPRLRGVALIDDSGRVYATRLELTAQVAVQSDEACASANAQLVPRPPLELPPPAVALGYLTLDDTAGIPMHWHAQYAEPMPWSWGQP